MNYLDTHGNIVTVTPGIGGTTFIAARVSKNGSLHRVKSSALPPCKTAVRMQMLLDRYARQHGWTAVEDEHVDS